MDIPYISPKPGKGNKDVIKKWQPPPVEPWPSSLYSMPAIPEVPWNPKEPGDYLLGLSQYIPGMEGE